MGDLGDDGGGFSCLLKIWVGGTRLEFADLSGGGEDGDGHGLDGWVVVEGGRAPWSEQALELPVVRRGRRREVRGLVEGEGLCVVVVVLGGGRAHASRARPRLRVREGRWEPRWAWGRGGNIGALAVRDCGIAGLRYCDIATLHCCHIARCVGGRGRGLSLLRSTTSRSSRPEKASTKGSGATAPVASPPAVGWSALPLGSSCCDAIVSGCVAPPQAQ